jgi:hypothetical protein
MRAHVPRVWARTGKRLLEEQKGVCENGDGGGRVRALELKQVC